MWGTCYVNAPPSPRARAYRKCTAIGTAPQGLYVVRASLGKLFHTIDPKADRAFLDQDQGQPGELAAHEHREPLDAPRPHVRPVMEQSAEQRDRREELAVLGGEHAVAQEQAAREAPEDPRADPSGNNLNEDRRAQTRSAEEARSGTYADADTP